MSQFQLSPSQMDALLAMAGKKMGADPKKLKQQTLLLIHIMEL